MSKVKEFLIEHKMIVAIVVTCVVVIALVIGLIFALLPKKDSNVLKPTSTPSSSISGDSGTEDASQDVSTTSEGEVTMPNSTDSQNPATSENPTGASSTVPGTSKTVSATSGNTTHPTQAGTKYLDFSKYNLDTYMTPVWKNNVVYNESIMFFPNAKTKQYDPAPLLYNPTKIISVRSSDLQTEFKQGKDYVVENGKIKLTANSSIYKWEYDEYYLLQPSSVPIGSASAPGRYVKYASGREYAEMQLAVTYEHSGSWSGPTAKYAGGTLKRTVSTLKAKKPLKILYYGDSIMTGCEATGMNKIEPYMPIFTQMVTAKLKEAYGYNGITEINTAVGGKETKWGLEEVHSRVTVYKPDIVVIGFGMNDSGVPISVAQYESNIRNMIKDIRTGNPNAEILLVSTTVPNPDCSGWTNLQPKYQPALINIMNNTSGVALVPMTDIQKYILTKKRYGDMNGNGVNHPNDFMARVYGQSVAQCLIENLK